MIEMIWWTGLAPWEFDFPFPGSFLSTVLCARMFESAPLPSDEGTRENVVRTLPERQSQNLAVTVLYVPTSFDPHAKKPAVCMAPLLGPFIPGEVSWLNFVLNVVFSIFVLKEVSFPASRGPQFTV